MNCVGCKRVLLEKSHGCDSPCKECLEIINKCDGCEDAYCEKCYKTLNLCGDDCCYSFCCSKCINDYKGCSLCNIYYCSDTLGSFGDCTECGERVCEDCVHYSHDKINLYVCVGCADPDKSVYAISRREDYEGSDILAIFSTKKRAIKNFKEIIKSKNEGSLRRKFEQEGDCKYSYRCGCDIISIEDYDLDSEYPVNRKRRNPFPNDREEKKQKNEPESPDLPNFKGSI